MVDNPASRRVLEKCGFVFVGTGSLASMARGGVAPVDCLQLDRHTWASLGGIGQVGLPPRRREDASPELAQVE